VTTPVEDDDLVQGCVTWLLDQPDVLAVLGTFDDGVTPLLFQHTTWRGDLEGSQSTAAIIMRDGGWGAANEHNTMRFPRITLEVVVDPIRDASGDFIRPGETYRRIENAYRVLDRHLHRPYGGTVYWGSVRIIDCIRLSEPDIVAVVDGDGMLRLQVPYGVSEG
jgi:hypothetical protein